MRDIVWVWLSTCIGVVEGDSNPVEAYLNSRGDPTRKLSHPEAQLLPRPGPGVYDADHQLRGLQTCGPLGPASGDWGPVPQGLGALGLERTVQNFSAEPVANMQFMSRGYTLLNYARRPVKIFSQWEDHLHRGCCRSGPRQNTSQKLANCIIRFLNSNRNDNGVVFWYPLSESYLQLCWWKRELFSSLQNRSQICNLWVPATHYWTMQDAQFKYLVNEKTTSTGDAVEVVHVKIRRRSLQIALIDS